MNKLKKVKKAFKSKNMWSVYKKKYRHPQTRLMFSKIALIYNSSLTPVELIKLEKKVLEASFDDQDKMFAEATKTLETLAATKGKWNEFGIFLFYVVQTSTYYKDIKKHNNNIYKKSNYVELNSFKRKHYHAWLKSLDHVDNTFNENIIKVLKVVW